MTTKDPDREAPADTSASSETPGELLDRWLADRADEVVLVRPPATPAAADDGDGSFDPDPWSGLELPEAELSPEQLDFLGALGALPSMVRGEDLVDRPAWDVTPDEPTASWPGAGADPGTTGT